MSQDKVMNGTVFQAASLKTIISHTAVTVAARVVPSVCVFVTLLHLHTAKAV